MNPTDHWVRYDPMLWGRQRGLIERLNRDGQGGLQIYSTTINIDIDDAEEESQVDERLDMKTIGSILLRIESSISSMENRLAAVERSQLDDTIQCQIPQRFGEATPIPASGLRSVMFSPSPAVTTSCYYCIACAIGSSLANYRGVAKSASGEILEADTIKLGHRQQI